jgi:molybdopterin synthase sulfur carrier subunit
VLKVLLFGRLGDVAGDTELGIPWDESLATIETVREQLLTKIPELADALGEKRTLVAVNQQICGSDTELSDGDEIAFMPPVTGG